MFRRAANSLFMEWRAAQRRPEHVTTTDFQAVLTQENRRRAIHFLTTKNPAFKKFS